jgi:Ca2+:H+ antiporter
MSAQQISDFLKKEWFLGIGFGTSLIFLFFEDHLTESFDHSLNLSLVFTWLFAVVLGCALAVVRHAEHLAVRLKEPYGTLILTLLVTSIEVVSISAVMMHGENDPTLARDTLFSVIMIILNGMVGLCLLIGAWRHKEQHYNLQGANTYLGVIIPLAVLSMILPDFTVTTPGPTFAPAQSMFLIFTAISLYGAFLIIQTRRHHGYFTLGDEEHQHAMPAPAGSSLLYHAILTGLYILPVVFLAEQLAGPLDYLLDEVHAPAKLGGLIIALLVATPEAIGAVRAASNNYLQRSINIFLGSVLSTIGLTIPAMLIISSVTKREIVLGLQHTDIVMLLLTLTVSVVTFSSGRTNVLQGVVHLILFAVYLLLIFQS